MVLTQQQKEKLDSMSLRSVFYELASLVTVDIDHPGVPIPIFASFYVLMGQYFRNVRIAFGSRQKDLRLNFFWIQPSRTGKGELSGVTKEVASGLGIRWAKVTKITDAGLLGSIDHYAIEYNYKHKLTEDDERWKNPVVIGDLGNYDIIFFDECKQLLEPQTYNENSMQIMQEALDYPGHVRSKLRFNYPIEYDCSCSIYATTYYLGQSIETSLLTTGFFQRMMPYMRDMTIEENEALRMAIIQKFRTTKLSPELYNDMLQYFVAKIRQISNTEKVIYLDDSAVSYLDKVFRLFNEEIRKCSGESLKILMAFSQTIIDICTKVGGIHAVLDGRDFVRASDIASSFVLARAMGNTVINKLSGIEQKNEALSSSRRVRNILLMFGGRLPTMSLVNEVCAKTGLGKNKAHMLLKRLVRENYLKEETGEGNTKYVSCVEV